MDLRVVITIKLLSDEAYKKVKCTLKQGVFDTDGSQVENLDEFIMNTDTTRELYLQNIIPLGCSYSLPLSVSKTAKSDPASIKNRFKKYPKYAHHFCLQVYNKFCEEPDHAAKSFFQNI